VAPSVVNCRFTGSVTVFWDGTRLARRRRGSPDRSARRMSSATVLCPTLMPWARWSSACTQGWP
jgi:hypothetical protein